MEGIDLLIQQYKDRRLWLDVEFAKATAAHQARYKELTQRMFDLERLRDEQHKKAAKEAPCSPDKP